jgi:hypothetical protein
MYKNVSEAWDTMAGQMRLDERCSANYVRNLRLMFFSGALYAATHSGDGDAILCECMDALKLFESNTINGEIQ